MTLFEEEMKDFERVDSYAIYHIKDNVYSFYDPRFESISNQNNMGTKHIDLSGVTRTRANEIFNEFLDCSIIVWRYSGHKHSDIPFEHHYLEYKLKNKNGILCIWSNNADSETDVVLFCKDDPRSDLKHFGPLELYEAKSWAENFIKEEREKGNLI